MDRKWIFQLNSLLVLKSLLILTLTEWKYSYLKDLIKGDEKKGSVKAKFMRDNSSA